MCKAASEGLVGDLQMLIKQDGTRIGCHDQVML